jgi:hypothetical protein
MALCRASRSLGNPLHPRASMLTRGRVNGHNYLSDFARDRPSDPVRIPGSPLCGRCYTLAIRTRANRHPRTGRWLTLPIF